MKFHLIVAALGAVFGLSAASYVQAGLNADQVKACHSWASDYELQTVRAFPVDQVYCLPKADR